ncbi:TPA: discoidin domain-containing protein [Candidatus Poribacteria bacterium]|nr:discoidin domain-containing protein [Candidatus Poribacteria bacterium]
MKNAANSSGDFSSQEDIAVATAIVPPNSRSWVTFAFDIPAHSYLVWLPPTEGIGWCFSNSEPMGADRQECLPYGVSWTKGKGTYCFRLYPPSLPYSGQNVVNGVSRPEENQPNIWISDPKQPLPQYIELDLDEPTEFNAVYLTFDTNLDKMATKGAVPQCAKDYSLYYDKNGEWVRLLSEKDNYHRRRKHTFNAIKTSKLRVQVEATNGADTARIYEVRVYCE